MNRTKKAGLSVKSGLSLMCIVCLLCGLLCGFFWLAGESSALAAGPDGSAPAAKAVVSGDVSLAAPERDEKLAVQAAAQATSPVVRTVAVGMDAGDYTETVTCDYTPVYVDDRFGGYCYVLDDAVWLPADAFAEMLGLESDTVTDGDTETVTVDGADIAATYGETYYTANGRCFYAPDGVYALDGEVVLPLADLEKIFGVTAVLSEDHTGLRVDASEQALLESGESYYGARDVYWLSHIINAEAGNQPMDGQIAVGNVVLNRVADERFPNSVKEVVFDRRGGVAQFSPTADGRISLTPDEDAELAAKLAFEGYDPVGESLYFINPSACNASWFNSRLTYTATIGDHVFYASTSFTHNSCTDSTAARTETRAGGFSWLPVIVGFAPLPARDWTRAGECDKMAATDHFWRQAWTNFCARGLPRWVCRSTRRRWPVFRHITRCSTSAARS